MTIKRHQTNTSPRNGKEKMMSEPLLCPVCRTPSLFWTKPDMEDVLESGTIECRTCKRRYHGIHGWTAATYGWKKVYIKPDMFPAGGEPFVIHEDERGTFYYEEENNLYKQSQQEPEDADDCDRLMAGDSNGGK